MFEDLSLVSVMSLLATVCTVGQFLTGSVITSKITQKGSTTGVTVYPFLTALVNCTFWLKYGVLIQDRTLVVVNSIGALLQTSYLVVYYAYTKQKNTLHNQLLGGAVVLFPVLIYVKFFSADDSVAAFHLGLIASGCAVLMYGAPLATMAEVLRTKCTETMTPALSVANFIVSSEWYIYGRLVGDLFIQVPNLLGALLGLVQLSLFVLYPRTPKAANVNQA
ncbi:sugar transporter SWEET1-like isoform X1 [Branchiostoma floridae x Branchiostoma belcheri]